MTTFDVPYIKSEDTVVNIDASLFAGKCRCCLSREALESMTEPFIYEGSSLTYCAMLHACFSIELPGCNSDYLICNCCILRLKFGFSFKNEVLRAQKKIRNENLIPTKDMEILDISQNHEDSSDDDNTPLLHTLKIKKELDTDTHKEITNNKENSKRRIKSNSKEIHPKVKRTRIRELSKEEFAKYKRMKGKMRYDSLIPYKLDKSCQACPICKEEFTSHQNLIIHMNIHYPHFLCSHCGKSMATKRQLDFHLLSHDNMLISCKICNKEVKKTSLTRHIKTHSGEVYVYRCPTCSERFKSFHQRAFHMAKLHNSDMPSYKCKFCPKEYTMSGTLSQHVRKEHLNERKHCCTECNKCFFAKTDLTNHIRIHTGERLNCNICSKGFLRPSKLNAHMKVHIDRK